MGRQRQQRNRAAVLGPARSSESGNTAAKTDLGFRQAIPWAEGDGHTVALLDEHEQIEDSDHHPFYDQIIAAWKQLSDRLIQGLASLDL